MVDVEKITVIGGSGFVGTNFCQQLADKQIPFEIIDIKQSQRFPEKCKIADVRDIESLRGTITGNVIVNLAAVHRDDILDCSEYHRTNVDGAANIAKYAPKKASGKSSSPVQLRFMVLPKKGRMKMLQLSLLMNMGALNSPQKKFSGIGNRQTTTA